MISTSGVDRLFAQDRAMDIEILWPVFRRHKAALAEARAAFLRSVEGDPAWRAIGHDEMQRLIKELS